MGPRRLPVKDTETHAIIACLLQDRQMFFVVIMRSEPAKNIATLYWQYLETTRRPQMPAITSDTQG